MATFLNEALNSNIGLWVKEESTPGDFEALVAADFLAVVGDPTIPTPVRELAENLERDGFLGMNPGILLKGLESTFSFTTYLKPSGTLGDVPVANALFKGVFGVETINGSTSVVYTFADIDTGLPSQTNALYLDNFCIWFSGKVNQLTVPVIASGGDPVIVPCQWEVMISEFYGWAGVAVGTTTGSAAEVTLATPAEALRYTAGALISVGTDDNTGAGYPVTAVDNSTGVLTLTGTPSAQASKAVVPFVPARTEPTGTEVAGYLGYAQIDDAGGYDNLKITQATIVINNNLVFRNDEKDDEVYTGQIIRANRRNVTIQTVAHFYEEYARYFNVKELFFDRDIKIPCGSVSKLICNFVAPQAKLPAAAIAGEPTLDLTLDWICYQSASGDDELSATFI